MRRLPLVPRHPTRRQWALWGALLLAVALAVWINVPVAPISARAARRVAALAAAAPFRPGERVLILSPHPDDETLCCAGVIQQALAAGARVDVAWITAGDGFEFDAALTQRTLRPVGAAMRALGNARVTEARRAVALLGVPAAHTYMLGYPDGGLAQLYAAHYLVPYRNARTGMGAVYVRGALTPGAPYTGQALEADLERVLSRVRPDLVLAPAPQDFHPDHHTLSYLAVRAMAGRGQADRLRFWVVHGGLEWPLPKGLHPGQPLTLPPRAAHLPWQRLDLTPAQERRKLGAINAYRTQTEVLGRFMRAFVRRNELLSPESLPASAPSAGASPAAPATAPTAPTPARSGP